MSVGNDEKKDNDSDDSDNDDNDNDLKKPVDNLNSDSGKNSHKKFDVMDFCRFR